MAPLQTAPMVIEPPDVPQPDDAWKDEDVAVPQAETSTVNVGQVREDPRVVAKKMMFRYIKFVVADVMDCGSMEAALQGNSE